MKQEDKELLLRYLSMALPYDIMCEVFDPQQEYEEDVFNAHLIQIDAWTSHCYFWGCSETDPYAIEQVKPYLRPMSSMTEEEDKQRIQLGIWRSSQTNGHEVTGIKPDISQSYNSQAFQRALIFLLKNHFDIFGLIPKGLAIAVTKENNPYNIMEE